METRKTKSGKEIYREKLYINGRPIYKSFKRVSDAKAWKALMLSNRTKAEITGIVINPDITLRDFYEMWIQRKIGFANRTYDAYKSVAKYIVPQFGHLNLRQIQVAHGHRLIGELVKDKKSHSRINFYLRFFNQLLNDAVKWDYLQNNPLKKIEKIKELPPKLVYWVPHEIEKFISANRDDEFFELFVVALNTGARRGELLGLNWDKVDFTNEQIEISRIRDRYGLKDTTKTGLVRYVPMNMTVKKVLLDLKQKATRLDYVFLCKDGSLPFVEHISDRQFSRAIKRADVRRIQFKHMRSSFASNFVMKGGDIFTLSKILGHTSVEMTAKKYAHLSQSYLKDAIKILEFKVDDSNSSKPTLVKSV